jgi:hypothetical protein
MKKGKKIIAFLGVIAMLATLFLAMNDIKKLFNKKVDISGEWSFEFHTKESTYNPYVNAITEYKMYLIQERNTIKGTGETWKYKGELVPYSDHNPLIIQGVIQKDTLICNYILKGRSRESFGSFKAYYKEGELSGRFSGAAANAKGEFFAKKIK